MLKKIHIFIILLLITFIIFTFTNISIVNEFEENSQLAAQPQEAAQAGPQPLGFVIQPQPIPPPPEPAKPAIIVRPRISTTKIVRDEILENIPDPRGTTFIKWWEPVKWIDTEYAKQGDKQDFDEAVYVKIRTRNQFGALYVEDLLVFVKDNHISKIITRSGHGHFGDSYLFDLTLSEVYQSIPQPRHALSDAMKNQVDEAKKKWRGRN